MGTIVRGAKLGGGTNFNAGQVIAPGEVNDDFNTLYTEANGLLSGANVLTASLPGAKSLLFTGIAAPSSPATGSLLLYAGTDGSLHTKDGAGVTNSLGAPRSYLAGMGMVQAADPDHDITIAAGIAKDSTNVADLILTTTLTKQLDAVWAVGTNAGGLDTGTIAQGWYHVWVIKRSDTGVVDALFSTSATAPTMPASYDYKRRIGSVLTDAGPAIVDFDQNGDEFKWLVSVLDVNAVDVEAATSRTLSVPTGVVVTAQVSIAADFTAVAQAALLNELTVTAGAPNVAASAGVTLGPPTAALMAIGNILVRTNTSAQIRSTTSGVLDSMSIITYGWFDRRGRDS